MYHINVFMIAVLTSCSAQLQDGEIHEAMLGVTNKLHGDGCIIVLLFDDSLSRAAANHLIMNLQKDDGQRTFLTFDLMFEKKNVTSPVEQISTYLQQLYHLNRCYTFIVWIHDPNVLYPPHLNIHPGWRSQDVIILAAHNALPAISRLRFWSAIPNIVGLRRPPHVTPGSNRVSIFTVTPHSKRSGPMFKEIDFWLVNQKKFERNVPLLWDKFISFEGAPIRVSILWRAPYYIFGDDRNPFVDGIDYRLLMLVHKYLHLSFDGSIFTSSSTSGRKYDGNWTGVFRHLQTGEADLAVGGLSSSGRRLADFDFTTSYYGDAYVFISPVNTSEPVVLDIFAKPLRREVWQMLLLTSLVLAATLKLISRIERKFGGKRGTVQTKVRDHPYTFFWHNIYFVYNAFCQKPFPHVPASNALRLIFIGTSLSIMVLGIIFAGFLFGQLFNARKEAYIDSFDQIVKSKLPVCIRDYDGTLNYGITKTRRDSIKRIWGNATFVENAASTQCIEDVVRGKGIYIDSYSRLHFVGSYQHMGINGIKFHFGRERLLYQTNMGWPTRKRWPFLPKISQILSRAVESGLVDYWMSVFKRGYFGWDEESYNIRLFDPNFQFTPIQNGTMDTDPTINLSSKNRFVRLGFIQFNTLMAMWAQGMLISIFIFLAELATHGTWTTVSWIKRFIRWIIALFKAKRMENELRLFEKVLEGSPTSGRKSKRRLAEGTRYFVWDDLTQGKSQGGLMDPAKPVIKVKKI